MTTSAGAGNTVVLASYDSYEQAQTAVDVLSDGGYPVQNVRIEGSGLRLVETVTGRLTTSRAALAGAGTGAWIGLLIGVIISLGTPYLLGPVLWGLLWGAIFGAIFGGLSHMALRGRRDFSSTRQLVASRYEVLVPSNLLLRAQQLLNITSVPAAPPPDQPTV